MAPPLRVLVIEDNRADFLLIERHLRQHGLAAECHCIANRADLVAALSAGWDAVLADYNVPTMDFRATLKLLRDYSRDLPVILVSGSVGEEAAVELLRSGLTDFVFKDRLTRLPAAIRRGLDEAAERRARRAATEALRQSEERLRLVFEATNDGVWDWDMRSNLAVLSPRYYEISGYQSEDVVPDLDFFRRLIYRDDLAQVFAVLDAQIQGEVSSCEFDFRMVTGSGAIKWVRSRGRMVKWDSDGKPLRMVGTIMDVTARKADEDALRRQADELARHNAELERFNRVTVGRELDMIELKRRINDLSRQLGREPPFSLEFLDPSPRDPPR